MMGTSRKRFIAAQALGEIGLGKSALIDGWPADGKFCGGKRLRSVLWGERFIYWRRLTRKWENQKWLYGGALNDCCLHGLAEQCYLRFKQIMWLLLYLNHLNNHLNWLFSTYCIEDYYLFYYLFLENSNCNLNRSCVWTWTFYINKNTSQNPSKASLMDSTSSGFSPWKSSLQRKHFNPHSFH